MRDEAQKSRRNRLIQEIIGPVMAEKGLSLRSSDDGSWTWEKDVGGIMEEIGIWDSGSRLSMTLGLGKLGARRKMGHELLCTLEHPRTEWMEWSYFKYSERERLYEDILLDMRDILLANCDTILERNAEEVRNAIPNRKHFEKLRDHCGQLAERYREELGTGGKDLAGICEAIGEQVRMRQGKPPEEVEDDLVGYAALLETELLRQYGGIREIHEELDSITISGTGYKRARNSFNLLGDIFWAWKTDGAVDSWKEEMRAFQDKDRRERMKGYNNLANRPLEETTVADVLEMVRQKRGFDRVHGLAMEKAVELLQADVFAGELSKGELMDIFRTWEKAGAPDSWKGKGKVMKLQDKEWRKRRKGYDNPADRPLEEVTVEDVLEMVRQKIECDRVYGLAMGRAVELLQADVFAGESFEGELMDMISKMGEAIFTSYPDELKGIAEDALEKSETYEWLYEAQKGEFLAKVRAVSKKL